MPQTKHSTPSLPDGSTPKLCVIGLGYVGLPLAIEFAKKFSVIGFDTKQARIDELRAGVDSTREIDAGELASASALRFTTNAEDIEDANVYIVTVPTPIDEHRRPDLRPLIAASHTVGKVLRAGDVVIYESTVYPGCTEEDCVPILEAESGLRCAIDSDEVKFEQVPLQRSSRSGPIGQPENQPTSEPANTFYVGYSPERINPGDMQHRVSSIVKVTSGSTPEAAAFVNALYGEIITAGTHLAPSIRVAEAAKVIENTQRDVNIALINELAMLFGKMGLDTAAVLEAAGTKWNFLPFQPGLVGGHCIGVDPYYLTHKAQQIGFHPQMILAGRRINDGMGAYVAGEVIKLMARNGVYRPGAKVLVLGLTFKENCPDLRNTKVVDVLAALNDYNLDVVVHDPWADREQARLEYGLELTSEPEQGGYDAVVLAVAHNEFRDLGNPGIRDWTRENGVVYDLKHFLPPEITDGRL